MAEYVVVTPLAEGTSLNTGESDEETRSLTESHRIDLRPYSRYVVVDATEWATLIKLVEDLAASPPRVADLRAVRQRAKNLVGS